MGVALSLRRESDLLYRVVDDEADCPCRWLVDTDTQSHTQTHTRSLSTRKSKTACPRALFPRKVYPARIDGGELGLARRMSLASACFVLFVLKFHELAVFEVDVGNEKATCFMIRQLSME